MNLRWGLQRISLDGKADIFGKLGKISQFSVTVFETVLLFGVNLEIREIGAFGDTFLLHSDLGEKYVLLKMEKLIWFCPVDIFGINNLSLYL